MSLSQKQLSALEAVLQNKPGLISQIKVYNALGNESKLKSVCLEAASYLHTQLKSLEPVSIPAQVGKAIVTPKPGFKFDLRPAQDSQPKPFQWGKFGQAMVNRLVGGSAKNG